MRWGVAAPATEYWGALWVGTPPERFNVLFDTGSGNLVLPGASCESTACKLHKRYSPKASSTAWVHDGAEEQSAQSKLFGFGAPSDLDVTFGSGGVSAQMVSDNVCLTESACVPLNLLMATEESKVFTALGADGVLGLGLSDLSVSGGYNLLQSLVEKHTLPANMFSVSLAGGASEITFGGYKEEQVEGALTWARVDEESGYWAVDMRVGGLPGSQAVLDTGSSVIAAPKPAYEKLKSFPCDEAPDLAFSIGGTKLVLPASAYRPGCKLLVVPLSAAAADDAQDVLQGQWVLGDPFLRSFVTVFDLDGRRVGFGRPRGRPRAGLLARARKHAHLLSIPLRRRVA